MIFKMVVCKSIKVSSFPDRQETLQSYHGTDIIIDNQLIYLVNTHHLTGFDYYILRKINETCQKLGICGTARIYY